MAVENGVSLKALAHYLAGSALGHLIWETLQLPLYTIWSEGTPGQIAFAVVHCTGGDMLIAGSAVLAALLVVGPRGWPTEGVAFRNVAIIAVALGVFYTVFSEWQNVNARGAWAYSAWMPRLPPFGTGLSPLMQWLVVPLISLSWTRRVALKYSTVPKERST